MGIPAYFRWISERYPQIMVNCVEHANYDVSTGRFRSIDASLPNPNGVEYDNLYLDMNGIIHPCTHPEDRPAPSTEAEMFDAVTDYIDRIFAIVRPRKLLYLAVDGVAPRAKINQQRSRRFRAAQEAQEKRKAAEHLFDDWKKLGMQVVDSSRPEDVLTPTDRDPVKDLPFDSNVITPGTPFMHRLAGALRKYAFKRLRSDKAWRNLVVVLSDAAVPGEGEHKIAEFIRRQRAHPGYNPNLQHVMYGLDADLIMLALATHEAYFTVLREEVFTKKGGRQNSSTAAAVQDFTKKQASNIDAVAEKARQDGAVLQSELGGRKPFHFLRIHILREYLDYEFKQDIEFELANSHRTGELSYDLERVLDDFVFMCFFVGNDFLPHLPTLDIREGAIDFLIEVYKTEIGRIGYLTSAEGEVDFVAVRKLLLKTGVKEDEVFEQRERKEQAYANRLEREKPAAKDESRKVEKGSNPKRSAEQTTTANYATGSDQRPSKKVKKEASDASGLITDTFELGRKNGKGTTTLTRRLFPSSSLVSNSKKAVRGAITGVKTEQQMKSKDTPASNENQVNSVIEFADGGVENKEIIRRTKEEFDTELKEQIRRKNELEVVDKIMLGRSGWKARYYNLKLGFGQDDREKKGELLTKYFEGLHWVMKYYYVGCVSWSWFYPYHYAPFASDLVESEIVTADIRLDPGVPFQPFTQLQAVMPASSGVHVLPECYHRLMSDPKSPIIDYYPEDLKLDLNGKRFAWQGVVLLPFIDVKRLLDALEPLQDQLTPEEQERNSFGVTYVLTRRDTKLGQARQGHAGKEEDTKAIENDAAVGYFFGSASWPLPKFGKPSDDVLVLRFEPPTHAPHKSEILPNVGTMQRILSEVQLGEARRGGWKAAKFGPFGRAAADLHLDRERRKGRYANRRGRTPSLAPSFLRPQSQQHGHRWRNWPAGSTQSGPGVFPASQGHVGAAAGGMFAGVGAGHAQQHDMGLHVPDWMRSSASFVQPPLPHQPQQQQHQQQQQQQQQQQLRMHVPQAAQGGYGRGAAYSGVGFVGYESEPAWQSGSGRNDAYDSRYAYGAPYGPYDGYSGGSVSGAHGWSAPYGGYGGGYGRYGGSYGGGSRGEYRSGYGGGGGGGGGLVRGEEYCLGVEGGAGASGSYGAPSGSRTSARTNSLGDGDAATGVAADVSTVAAAERNAASRRGGLAGPTANTMRGSYGNQYQQRGR